MRLRGSLLAVIAVAAVPASAAAGAAAPTRGRLYGVFSSAGAATAAGHHAKHARPVSRLVILTSPSGHKQRIKVPGSGHFFAKLAPGQWRICGAVGRTTCSGNCPVVLTGTRFGPTDQSAPVIAIPIEPGIATHVRITCGS